MILFIIPYLIHSILVSKPKKNYMFSLSLDLHGSWFRVLIIFYFLFLSWWTILFYCMWLQWFLDYFVLYLHISISSFYTIDKTTIYWLQWDIVVDIDFSDVHIGVDYSSFLFFFLILFIYLFMINQLLDVHIVVDIDFSDVHKNNK